MYQSGFAGIMLDKKESPIDARQFDLVPAKGFCLGLLHMFLHPDPGGYLRNSSCMAGNVIIKDLMKRVQHFKASTQNWHYCHFYPNFIGRNKSCDQAHY